MLPEYLDPVRMVEKRSVLEGSVAQASMPRLSEALVANEGEALAHLEFDRDLGRRPIVRGWARTTVSLACQRCLGPVAVPLDVEFTLALVADEAEASRLPEEYEPLIHGNRPVRTAELVEDELILALPIVPMHAEDDPLCVVEQGTRAQVEEGAKESVQPNPFAVLQKLKNRER